MSGGHWGYLRTQLEERAGQPLNEVWRLLGEIEYELDWGICSDTCYDCAKIRVVNALEAYFDSGATDVVDSLRILRDREPECERCKKWREQRNTPREIQPRQSATVEAIYNGKKYRGVVYAVEEGE